MADAGAGPVPGLLPAPLPCPAAGAFTTRVGGVSGGVWAQGNLGLHVDDDPDAVQANRRGLARALGLAAGRLVFGQQVHGRGVAVVGPDPTPGAVPGVDGLVTRTRGLGLVMMAADCLPVLLADPAAGVVASAHAGRAGLVEGVLEEVLAVMARLGATPGGTTAVLGPAVCGSCYELPGELADEVGRRVPGSRSTSRQGTPAADLTAGAEALLAAAGVGRTSRVGGCTVEQPDVFFSHRRSGVTGRHAGVVWLRPAGPVGG